MVLSFCGLDNLLSQKVGVVSSHRDEKFAEIVKGGAYILKIKITYKKVHKKNYTKDKKYSIVSYNKVI